MNQADISARFGDDFRRCLIAGDVREMMRLWNATAPAWDRIVSLRQAEAILHIARTQSGAMPLKLRQYSRRWLDEHGLGAFVPGPLKSIYTVPDSMRTIQ
jgi:hypothetical protein